MFIAVAMVVVLIVGLGIGIVVGKSWEKKAQLELRISIERNAVNQFARQYLGVDGVRPYSRDPNFTVSWSKDPVEGQPKGYSSMGTIVFPLSLHNPKKNVLSLLKSFEEREEMRMGLMDESPKSEPQPEPVAQESASDSDNGLGDESFRISGGEDSPFEPVGADENLVKESPFPSDSLRT